MRCRRNIRKEHKQWDLFPFILVATIAMAIVLAFQITEKKISFPIPNPHSWSEDKKYVCLTREEYVRLLKESDSATFHKAAYEQVQAAKIMTVTATAYNATTAQCGKADGITSSGTKVRQGRTIAVSRDLKHLMGHRVELLDGSRRLGFFVVEDLMSDKIKGHKIDVYLDRETEAEWFGRKNLKMVILGKA